MDDRESARTPFDERAALEELERLQAQIVRLRSKRVDAGADFERFVRSLRTGETKDRAAAAPVRPETTVSPDVREEPDTIAPQPPPASSVVRSVASPAADRAVASPAADRAIAPPIAPPIDVQPAAPATPAPSPSSIDVQAWAPVEMQPAAARSMDVQPRVRATPRRSSPAANWAVIAASALLLLVAGVVAWSLRTGEDEPSTQEPVAATQPPSAAQPSPPPSPAATPRPSSPHESVIVTIRPAWVRVIADGERILERELPAQARVPFRATKTIVVRTGDAGAVRLSIGARDHGPLGGDGAVVTRTFAVPPR